MESSKDKTIVALIYDFDKTLCDKDMQEYSFIPSLGLSSEEFWEETDKVTEKNHMDKVLSYMYMMIHMSNKKEKSIKREDFVKLGKDINLYPGVKDWFTRINEYGESIGITVEHYIISSGLKEIIEGTEIAKYFKEIYACEFLYDHNGIAVWPAMSVNYTAKTQFLSRINKGVLDISDDTTLNRMMLEDDRRISTKNMLYVGDGITDIPSMRMVRGNGGYTIAVYQQNKEEIAKSLLAEDRASYAALADYTENSTMDKLIKTILLEMKINTELRNIHKEQLKIFTNK